MCGNFGLLSLGEAPIGDVTEKDVSGLFKKEAQQRDAMDQSLNESMHEVSRLHGMKVRGGENKSTAKNDVSDTNHNDDDDLAIVPALSILQCQTSSTEIRGGQAGGYSSFEYKQVSVNQAVNNPIATRVRMVAKKRHPLAADLANHYLHTRGGRHPDIKSTLSVIGHTRFATSSVNQVSELHPHEWVPFHEENVWLFDTLEGRFERRENVTVGIHISHNGDFDAMEAYSQTMVVDEIGLWLEKVLHCPNNTKGDSPKIAGCMDLFRVQGRWAAAARLAWIRCVLTSATDVCGGQQLSKQAPNTFPDAAYWENWAVLLEKIWIGHVNNVISATTPNKFDIKKQKYTYSIDERGLKQFILSIVTEINSEQFQRQQTNAPTSGIQYYAMGMNTWSSTQLFGFLHYLVRGFLRSDCYNAMTELLSRAEGSFGLQAHCTLEPGVVVIASKGQPMSLAFDPRRPVVLFGSEAEALSAPVYKSGQWLVERIDLDSHGEVVRLGAPRTLQEGSFRNVTEARVVTEKEEKVTPGMKRLPSFKGAPPSAPLVVKGSPVVSSPPVGARPGVPGLSRQGSSAVSGLGRATSTSSPTAVAKLQGSNGKAPVTHLTAAQLEELKKKQFCGIKLQCGIEIRAYSLVTCSEFSAEELQARCVSITAAPVPFDPKVDLVANDLAVTPAVIAAIDRTWSNGHSIERVSGQSLAENLVKCMRVRLSSNKDTTDLLIGGVEASLWMAEQWAADMRSIFPQLNVVTLSTNKILGLGDENPQKVFFPGADEVLTRRIDSNTCVLLISQSGQTFPTLHATRKMAKFAGDKLWLLTGCFNSKMEQAMVDGYKERGTPYLRNRVFNNYSGSRPAEPSSVAVAATWHTLTRMLMHIVVVVRASMPAGRVIHPWDYDDAAMIIQLLFRRSRRKLHLYKQRSKDVQQTVRVNDITTILEGEDDDREEISGLSVSVSNAVVKGRKSSSKTYKIKDKSINAKIVMNLTDGCIVDMTSLLTQTVVPQISQIVGYDAFGQDINKAIDGVMPEDTSPHAQLVKQGQAWAAHVNEPWIILICVGIYMFFSIGLQLPLFGLLGDAVVAIIKAGGGDLGEGTLCFTPRTPHIMYQQGVGWTLVGLALQLIDALWYIYLGKQFTTAARYFYNRPLHARPGKRTIVIVDTPCVHQLLENFVSKLYAQSYSTISVDVHGASGLDHFVHRFTHRVVRGVLIAVGRPDGRLCCLAKSEAAVLLAAKQAAFIRNPDYQLEGSGPDMVTVGHNPFIPSLGSAKCIVLNDGKSQNKTIRRKFVDEYLYDRLFLANKPFTTAILRTLRRGIKSKAMVRRESLNSNKFRSNLPMVNVGSVQSLSMSTHKQKSEPLPYGVHHIDPSILIQSDKIETTVFADFVLLATDLLKNKAQEGKMVRMKGQSFDPAMRLAFSTKLDSQTKQIQELQVVVQQFYECRIASLERYLSFCVMFHAMAAASCKPWFKYPWDIAKSQSNLRVATTASPISAATSQDHIPSQETKKIAHKIGFALRKFKVNF